MPSAQSLIADLDKFCIKATAWLNKTTPKKDLHEELEIALGKELSSNPFQSQSSDSSNSTPCPIRHEEELVLSSGSPELRIIQRAPASPVQPIPNIFLNKQFDFDYTPFPALPRSPPHLDFPITSYLRKRLRFGSSPHLLSNTGQKRSFPVKDRNRVIDRNNYQPSTSLVSTGQNNIPRLLSVSRQGNPDSNGARPIKLSFSRIYWWEIKPSYINKDINMADQGENSGDQPNALADMLKAFETRMMQHIDTQTKQLRAEINTRLDNVQDVDQTAIKQAQINKSYNEKLAQLKAERELQLREAGLPSNVNIPPDNIQERRPTILNDKPEMVKPEYVGYVDPLASNETWSGETVNEKGVYISWTAWLDHLESVIEQKELIIWKKAVLDTAALACLRGKAFLWYSAFTPENKRILRTNVTLQYWQSQSKALRRNPTLRRSEAMTRKRKFGETLSQYG